MSNIYWDSCIFIYYLEGGEDIRMELRAQLSSFPNAMLCHLEYGCESFWTRNNRLGRAASGNIRLVIPV